MRFARESSALLPLALALAGIAFAVALGRRSWSIWMLAVLLLVAALWVAYLRRDARAAVGTAERLAVAPTVSRW